MTKRQKELQKHLIKVCHTLKANKFPDDDTRKDYLYMTYGVESLSDMNIDQLKEFAVYLGYGRKNKAKPANKEKAENDVSKATQRQIDTIEGIWFRIADKKTDFALRNYINRIVGYRPLYLRFLSRDEAQKVINGLLQMQRSWKSKNDDKNG